jgi:hypothetical protein
MFKYIINIILENNNYNYEVRKIFMGVVPYLSILEQSE